MVFGLSACCFGAQNSLSPQVLSERLLGVSIAPTDPNAIASERLLSAGDPKQAARLFTQHSLFLNVKVRDLAAQYTNIDENPVVGFDDLQALFIGIVRDNRDARELLTANYRYQAVATLNLPPVSLTENKHYPTLEARTQNLAEGLEYHEPQWDGVEESAGALTTYAFAKAHYSAGTNRRAFKFAFQEFLCRKPEQWRQLGLPDDRVRRDVDRAPAGLPMTYQQECRGCHSGMDAMAGAFSRFDFKDTTFEILGAKQVHPKFNQNAHVFPFGHKTVDSSWSNRLTQGHNQDIGWNGPTQGKSIRAFAEMIAQADAFAECLAERVFRHVCRIKEPSMALKRELAEKLRNANFQLRELFIEAAIHPACGDGK